MFREMRRHKQALSQEECLAVLDRATSGVLAVTGDDDYPYTVPLSYVRQGDCLYFHCGHTGHKLDGIARNPKVSFCVIDQDEIVSEEYTTYYRSVVVFATARVLADPAEKRAALELLATRYAPNDPADLQSVVDKQLPHTTMVELRVHHITGKEAAELARRRQK